MRRVARLLLGVAALALVASAIVYGPTLLRLLPGFEVRRVEITGTKLLAPQEVLAASGITAGESVWEAAAVWEAALESHPVIQSAEVSRRLPGTLRLRIAEKIPVAYVMEEVLAPVTAAGERLPFRPAAEAPDLPIVRSEVGDEVPLRLLEEAQRLALIDSDLLAEVSEIVATEEDGRVLLLRHREAEIVVPAGVTLDRLMELRAVLSDLKGRLERVDGGVPHIDLRFADQVIVRLPSSVQKL